MQYGAKPGQLNSFCTCHLLPLLLLLLREVVKPQILQIRCKTRPSKLVKCPDKQMGGC